MTTIISLQGKVAYATRSMHGVRGIGRLSWLLNRGFLRMGASPIQVAQMRDGTRMRVDLRSQTEWYTFYSGRYDDEAILLIQRLLSKLGGDFLDVGANIGMYSVRVSAGLGSGRRSVCFEPMPDNAARVRENAWLNGLDGHVEVHPIALSDIEGETELVLREDFESGAATGNASVAISDDADQGFHKITVPMRRFDDVLSEKDGVTFKVAKVDIEGHEDFFLRGAAEWLHRDRPVILTEINNWFYEKRGTTSSAVLAPCLPKNYETALLRVHRTTCEIQPYPIADLAGLRRVETCLIYPAECRDYVHQSAG
jgi:FkbM family methyltransferase